MVRRSLPFAAIAAAGLMLAACSGSGPAASHGTTATAATSPGDGSATGASSPGGGSTSSGGSTSGSTRNVPALQSRFVKVIGSVEPSVVEVQTNKDLGSGIVFDSKGDVVTNNHVVTGSTSFSVLTSTGHRSRATLVGTFPEDDLAVLHAAAVADIHPASFANSKHLRVGDIVLAVGNPLGLASSVTQGIVSALGRTVTEPNGTPIPDAIQTSAPINPGNSGGALVDLAGKVVGVPTLTAQDPQIGGAAVGIGFAIPSDTVRTIAGQIVKYGKVENSHRAYLGIAAANLPTGRGVLVAGVTNGGPATTAGVRPGDVILAIAGHATPSPQRLAVALAALTPGRTAKLRVAVPGHGEKTLQVTLGQYPG